jgi:hypothetical protein
VRIPFGIRTLVRPGLSSVNARMHGEEPGLHRFASSRPDSVYDANGERQGYIRESSPGRFEIFDTNSVVPGGPIETFDRYGRRAYEIQFDGPGAVGRIAMTVCEQETLLRALDLWRNVGEITCEARAEASLALLIVRDDELEDLRRRIQDGHHLHPHRGRRGLPARPRHVGLRRVRVGAVVWGCALHPPDRLGSGRSVWHEG